MTNQSWDAFKREHLERETVDVEGVAVPVPADLPFGFKHRAEQLSASSSEDDVAELVGMLFGPDIYDQLVDAGLGAMGFLTLLMWGMAQGSGRDLSFSEAYEIVTSDDPGKAAVRAIPQNRAARRAASKPRSTSTGARSSRTSAASTGSARKTSRA
jgi:hypothetical protein